MTKMNLIIITDGKYDRGINLDGAARAEEKTRVALNSTAPLNAVRQHQSSSGRGNCCGD
jgi:hypothetical protein